MKHSGDHNLTPDLLIQGEEESSWLVTYADLMTILLVFFVLLYTLSFFEKEKYRHAVEDIKIKLDQNRKTANLRDFIDIRQNTDKQFSIEDITGLHSRKKLLFNKLVKFADSGTQANNIAIVMKDGKIIVRVKGKALFKSGSASLNKDAAAIFDNIIKILKKYPDYNINIKGHTDDVPISTPVFPSNWELSAVRATTVLKYLISKGISPSRLTATGYGDVMPLVPNTSEKNRAQNRRVEFVLEKKEPAG
jgi:chemotaxis protein MotB